jgi:hypothetical protein
VSAVPSKTNAAKQAGDTRQAGAHPRPNTQVGGRPANLLSLICGDFHLLGSRPSDAGTKPLFARRASCCCFVIGVPLTTNSSWTTSSSSEHPSSLSSSPSPSSLPPSSYTPSSNSSSSSATASGSGSGSGSITVLRDSTRCHRCSAPQPPTQGGIPAYLSHHTASHLSTVHTFRYGRESARERAGYFRETGEVATGATASDPDSPTPQPNLIDSVPTYHRAPPLTPRVFIPSQPSSGGASAS